MRVGFYLENRYIPDVDLSKPELGNPGCGGTEYLFSALPYYLSTLQQQACTPVIFANHVKKLPKGVMAIQVEHLQDAARCAKREGVSFFVYRPRRHAETEFLELIDELQLPTIAWAHITPIGEHLRKMASTAYLKAVVCVEHEQYDLAQDSAVWSKLTYIVNGFDLKGFQLQHPPAKKSGLVVYLGALVPQKGFHLLAKVWPHVLVRCPEAKLVVIGTGALYGEDVKLGPWGVADSDYEKNCIAPYLSDESGSPDSSVKFLGKLGAEKKDILYEAVVGVPNPTGQTENCPGSALEFQACGTAVVSGAYYGMLDTVRHKETGLLGRSEDDLVNNICNMLNMPEISYQLGINGVNFIQERYNYVKVTTEWMDLFNCLQKDEKPKHKPFKKNFHQHSKFFTLINRYLQIVLGRIIFWPSIIEIKVFIIKKINWIKNGFHGLVEK